MVIFFGGGGLTVISAILNRQFVTGWTILNFCNKGGQGWAVSWKKEKSQINHPWWWLATLEIWPELGTFLLKSRLLDLYISFILLLRLPFGKWNKDKINLQINQNIQIKHWYIVFVNIWRFGNLRRKGESPPPPHLQG